MEAVEPVAVGADEVGVGPEVRGRDLEGRFDALVDEGERDGVADAVQFPRVGRGGPGEFGGDPGVVHRAPSVSITYLPITLRVSGVVHTAVVRVDVITAVHAGYAEFLADAWRSLCPEPP